MKNLMPAIIFCVFPFLLVLSLEGLSPFSLIIGLLTMGALLCFHFQARAGINGLRHLEKDDEQLNPRN